MANLSEAVVVLFDALKNGRAAGISLDTARSLTDDVYLGVNRTEIEAWLAGHDRGISSDTIVAYLTPHMVLVGDRDIPHDPDDFGRCYRLLKAVPDLRRDLHKVAEFDPRWAPLVENWVELERLWEEEHPFGTCPKLYARMKELTG